MKDEAPAKPGETRHLLHGVDWAVQAGVAEEVMRGTRERVRRRRRRQFAATSSALAIVVVAGAVWFSQVYRAVVPTAAPASVAAPGTTAVVWTPEKKILPDGSVVDLRHGAEISVNYSAAGRRVALIRGEAHFQVARNDQIPFIVAAGGVEARAVGTAFSVQLGQLSVEVLVTQGCVSVDKAPPTAVSRPESRPAPVPLAVLEAGSRVVVDVANSNVTSTSAVQALSSAELDQCLAWRVARLEFSRTPLSEVIRLIGQHSNTRLTLDDPRIGEVRISGILRADNVETLLRLLAAEHGIEADLQPTGEILLRAKR